MKALLTEEAGQVICSHVERINLLYVITELINFSFPVSSFQFCESMVNITWKMLFPPLFLPGMLVCLPTDWYHSDRSTNIRIMSFSINNFK
jgi:hypothetical protein